MMLWRYRNALDVRFATEMAGWVGYNLDENKGVIKTLLWLNLFENRSITTVKQ